MADKNHIPVMDVSSEVFHSLSGKDGPQGLAAVGQQKWFSAENLGSSINGIWIALYQVADPGNLGTILRTLDGMGGVGVFLLDYCTDPYDPSSIRASMGTIFSKKIIRIQSDDFINWVKKNSIMLIGTSDSAAGNYRDCHYPENMVLLMGSEREGLTTNLENACASIVSIPMTGSADSLNLAVASSIILYEIARQHPLSGREGIKMIASLEGNVTQILEDSIVINVSGIGFKVNVPANVCRNAEPHKVIALYTYLVVREDALTLFGFESIEEREMFILLLGTSGVGPRTALAIISTLSLDIISNAVIQEHADIF